MNRQLWVSRSLVGLATLLLAVASAITPMRAGTSTAFGCNDPRIGGYVGVFATCEECEFTGMDGASQGVWTTWHCRVRNDGYYDLYAT